MASNGSSIASAPGNGSWPVLLFGCAQGTTMLLYDAICSQVASDGYVVVSYDTLYDTDIVQYSDGNIITANTSLQATDANVLVDVSGRVQDASFILDQLSNASFITPLIPNCNYCLNTTRAGMFGHSVGGATAISIMLNDTRIAGGLNLDGSFLGDVVTKGVTRPFMPFMLVLTSEQSRCANESSGDPESTWCNTWTASTGSKYNMIIENSKHYTFSDLPIVLQTLEIHPNKKAMELEQVTDLDWARALHIVTTYTVTFFDYVLKGKSDELLTGKSALFPEIVVDNVARTARNATASSPAPTLAPPSTLGSSSVLCEHGCLRFAAVWMAAAVISGWNFC